MDKSQINEVTNFTKKKSQTNKAQGTSKVIEALDKPSTALDNPPVDEPVQAENENDEPPVTGHQRSAKNYTLAELNLLNRCMAIAAPIGPQGITEAVNLLGSNDPNTVVLNSFLIFPGEDLLKLNHFTHCFV